MSLNVDNHAKIVVSKDLLNNWSLSASVPFLVLVDVSSRCWLSFHTNVT